MSSISGLAASIRRAVESETFDLAGKSASTIETATKDAFREPFSLGETIRLTFVTGAGKLARQKYDDGAAKAITGTLRDLGYEDDHSGGDGTFKLQHDTGKNLKTVVVYPRVNGTAEKGIGGMTLNDAAQTESLLEENSPEYKLAYSSMNVFERMVGSKCQTWSQKKGCITAIDAIKSVTSEVDGKLLSGTPLTDSEQEFYDSVSLSSLEEKQNSLKEMMHKQIDSGSITSQERKMLLQQVSERMESLAKDIAEAEKQGKAKRVQNLNGLREKANARKEKLENTSTKAPPPFKNQNEINQLRTEMRPLQEIEDKAKGRLLSIKETQAVARKDEILEEIEALENDSRGWFESDEAFEVRVEASRAASKSSVKKAPKKKPAGKAAPAAPTKWVTPGAKKQAWSKPAAAKPKPKGGGVFAAMMMDSDSD